MLIDRAAEYADKVLSATSHRLIDYGFGIRYSYVVMEINGKKYIGVVHTLYNHMMGKPSPISIDPGKRISQLVSSIDPYRRHIGHCMINAVNQYLLAEAGSSRHLLLDRDPLDIIDPRGKKIVFIGDVRPIVDSVKEYAEETIVFEAAPCRRDPAYPPFYYHRVLPRADIVFISGSAVTNDSIDEILSSIRPGATTILIGPSASLPSQPLLGTRITMIASIIIPPDKTDTVRQGLIRGAGTRFIAKQGLKYIEFIDRTIT